MQVIDPMERVYKLPKRVLRERESQGIDSEVTTVLVIRERTILNDRFTRVLTIAFLASSDKFDIDILSLDHSSTEILED